jgi:hypothetical protein
VLLVGCLKKESYVHIFGSVTPPSCDVQLATRVNSTRWRAESFVSLIKCTKHSFGHCDIRQEALSKFYVQRNFFLEFSYALEIACDVFSRGRANCS